MIPTRFDRLARQTVFTALLLGLAATATTGCATADLSPMRTAGQPRLGQHLQVERNRNSRKMSFRDLDSSRVVVMKYGRARSDWGSPLNWVVDEDLYDRQSHRVRYRFLHPVSGEPLILRAKAQVHRVVSVPVRDDDTATTAIELFAGEEKTLRGTLRYEANSPVRFSGQIAERRVEIEQVSGDIPPETVPPSLRVVKYLLFPFPEEGDFIIRVDGREAARFTKHVQEEGKSPYDLTLDGELDQATRDDALLAFIVFDLIGDFVQSIE
jgi:hypothetical protein